MITSWSASILPIFVEIGPRWSARHIAEVTFVTLCIFPFLSFLLHDARSAKRGIAIVSRPSVRLYVRLSDYNTDVPWAHDVLA